MDLPSWVAERVARLACPRCHRKLAPDDITSLGVKENREKSRKRPVLYLFIEQTCGSCGKRAGFDLERCSLKQFALVMVRDYLVKKKESASRRPMVVPSIRPGTPTHPITDVECERARRSLARIAFRPKARSWLRFLQRLGVGGQRTE